MEKIIKIGDKEVTMRATAGTPRRYRAIFHRDLMSDMVRLSDKLKKNGETGSEFDNLDLTIFENVAYIMAKQADSSLPDIDAWFDTFDIFDIYQVLPEILSLWGLETETQVQSKKNLIKAVGK